MKVMQTSSWSGGGMLPPGPAERKEQFLWTLLFSRFHGGEREYRVVKNKK